MRSSLLDTMREDYLVLARAKGLRDVVVRNRHAVPNALLPVVDAGRDQLRLRALGRDRGRDDLLLARARASRPTRRSTGPDLPMLQGLFLVFSAAVILFNLLADLLYAALDPRVRDGMSAVAASLRRAGSPGCGGAARSPPRWRELPPRPRRDDSG